MNTIDREKFGDFIARKRKEKNLTQKDLADKLFISPQAVSKWERGQSYPDITLLIPLSDILEVKLKDLLQGEENSDSQVEDLIRKVVDMSATNPEEERRKKKRNIKIFSISIAIACIEYFILYKYANLDLTRLLTPIILGLIFASQTWIFVSDKLPTYYDENKISFVSNGFFRINLAGLSFNNSNWKPVLTYLRIWTLGLIFISPLIELALRNVESQTIKTLGMVVPLLILFVPVYIIGKKYE